MMWDLRSLTKPVETYKIDTSSGIIYPWYDADLHMLYLAGKGDGNIRYYEF